MKFFKKHGFNKKSKTINNSKIQDSGNENYLLIYPKSVEEEVSRSINSMGFVDKEIPADKTYDELLKELEETNRKLDNVDKNIDKIKQENKDIINHLPYTLDYYNKSNNLKENMVKGTDYFYFSGWVPQSSESKVKDLSNKYDKLLVTEEDTEKIEGSPPTKLKNNNFFKPFEFMVKMYGTPSYDEIDPTGFFAITYMLLYGMMFGDLGQGLIFILLSYFVGKKNNLFGSLLRRIGISASIFGLMYGSFFGIENLIPTLLIKPFDNIIKVLIASVSFGVILLLISFCIGIYNKLFKQKDLEEGLFGKEGVAGLIMMISFIMLILNIVKVNPAPIGVSVTLLILSIVMIIFKQPLSRKLLEEDELYDSKKSDYYVESSFSIIEALLSVFSNLVSFTRVGAFAINHVGLYMAFEVMAKLAGGGIAGIIILILGNILIIGLEGMIVSIQGLRLEFYEMFSKYYKGEGHDFVPISRY